jgi:hypothetical protein
MNQKLYAHFPSMTEKEIEIFLRTPGKSVKFLKFKVNEKDKQSLYTLKKECFMILNNINYTIV